MKVKKDYYAILGVPKAATESEIKEAYRKLAKIYHPDVSTDAKETSETSADKFRDIAEAYAVLSNKSMRMDYDLRLRNFPDAVYNKEKMKNMEESQRERDVAGNKPVAAPLKGSYADFRLAQLKKMRKEFNVDDNGFYKGGVPRQAKFNLRGSASGLPGQYHNPYLHNEIHDTPDAKRLTSQEALEHKRFLQITKDNHQKFKPYFNMDEIDTDTQFEMDNEARWLFAIPLVLFSVLGSYYIYSYFNRENYFTKLYKRVQDLEPYEVNIVGPVMFEAPRRKFENKYLTREEYHKWLENDIRSFQV